MRHAFVVTLTLALAAPAAAADRPPRTLPIPGATAPADSPGAAQGGRLLWTVPQGWVEEPPASPMRLAQYRVRGDGGDGECIVYYFGPGQGGDARANAERWASQFTRPDGSPAAGSMRMTTLEGTSVPVSLVEVTGTYDGGMSMTAAPAEPKPGTMLLGAIAQGPDAPWFFKFTGPEATVRAQRPAFLALLESLRRGD